VHGLAKAGADSHSGAETTSNVRAILGTPGRHTFGLDFALGGSVNSSDRRARLTARKIAGLFKGVEIYGNSATEEEFLETLANSRCVHIWSYGLHYFAVWSLRSELHELHTVDLTGLNLRNLELVTLRGGDSAPERSDAHGDPGVLATILLAAGVPTVVGTLLALTSVRQSVLSPVLSGNASRCSVRRRVRISAARLMGPSRAVPATVLSGRREGRKSINRRSGLYS